MGVRRVFEGQDSKNDQRTRTGRPTRKFAREEMARRICRLVDDVQLRFAGCVVMRIGLAGRVVVVLMVGGKVQELDVDCSWVF